MKDVIKRAEQLKEYKDRVNESFKHLRGRHNQLDHAWNRGMGRGDGGAALAPNQMGPIVSEDFYRQRKVELMNQQRQGVITNAEMRQQLNDMRGLIPDEAIFANRGKPKKGTTAQVSPNRPTSRPERLAKLPLAHRRISDPSQRRRIAQEQQAEWTRRHRMTKTWATLQGPVSPSAMFATPIESRHDQYEIDDTSTNLFENPYLIEGVDESGNPTNFMDFYITQYNALTSRIEQVLDQLVAAGTLAEDDVQRSYDKVLDAEQIIRQAVLRKAAATFATDIQGFLGMPVYDTDDPEFTSAMMMAADANQKISIQSAIVDDFGDRISQLPGLSDDDRKFFAELFDSFISAPYNKWSATQLAAQGIRADMPGRSPEAPLARMNPSLTADVIERSIEYASGSVMLSDTAQRDMMRDRIMPRSLPATSYDRISMSLPALMGFLHPKIRQRLNAIMNQAIQYPANENPSEVIKTIPGEEFGPESKAALDITKGMMDAVHSDGGMSDVSVAEAYDDDGVLGYFSSRHEVMARSGIPDTGNPVVVLVDPQFRHQDLPYPTVGLYATLAHEMAHHMDATALPFGSTYWRDTPVIADPSGSGSSQMPIPTLTTMIGEHGGIPPEIGEKAAFAPAVLEIMSRYQQTVQSRNRQLLSTKDPFAVMELTAFYKYLDAPHEVFARLYEQYMVMKLRDRLQSGQDVPGIKPEDRQRALESVVKLIEKRQGKHKQGAVQYFFEDADMPIDQLEQIFAIMGWKVK